MADVAARAGVSHQTVSRVLNGSPLVREETRARVTEVMAEMGYRRNNAARILATNRSRRIGVVSAHLALYGPSMIANAVQRAGNDSGYEVALLGLEELSTDSLQEAVDRLMDQAVEAVVVAIGHRQSLDAVLALDLPVPVVLAEGVAVGQAMSAGIDQEAGAVLATGHLLDLGHRSVAHVTGPLDWVEAAQRRDGWARAHERKGRTCGPELYGDWSARSGYEAGLALAEDASVTAVFVGNDAMSLGLLKALHERGRQVPDEISVVGFDDVPEAPYYWPALTTVRQDFSTLGRRALDLALRALEGEQAPAAEPVVPELVVRDSTAAFATG